MTISTNKLLALISLGLLSAIVVSIGVAKHVGNEISEQISLREMEYVYGAIESGPLQTAHLQAASIAQEQLTRLMENSALKHRNLIGVKISGGQDNDFLYASWNSPKQVGEKCSTSDVRTFRFADSLNPFSVEVSRDSCTILPEIDEMLRRLGWASFLIVTVAVSFLAFAVSSVISSLMKVDRILSGKATSGEIEQISFLPVRKLVERAQRNIALEKGAALTMLATSVAHDIRSPISALNMLIGSGQSIAESERDMMRMIAKRINDVADNLLKAQFQPGSIQEPAVNRSASIEDLISEVVAEKRLLFNARPELQIRLEPSKTRSVLSSLDESEFARILSNLINNAAEAIKDAGTINITVTGTQDSLQVRIQDTGAGIEGSLLNRLGNQRMESRKITGDSGSGIGLWTAKQKIQEAGGNLDIQSKVGVGTIVSITLPRANRVGI